VTTALTVLSNPNSVNALLVEGAIAAALVRGDPGMARSEGRGPRPERSAD
jgi:hypothetical protein